MILYNGSNNVDVTKLNKDKYKLLLNILSFLEKKSVSKVAKIKGCFMRTLEGKKKLAGIEVVGKYGSIVFHTNNLLRHKGTVEILGQNYYTPFPHPLFDAILKSWNLEIYNGFEFSWIIDSIVDKNFLNDRSMFLSPEQIKQPKQGKIEKPKKTQ